MLNLFNFILMKKNIIFLFSFISVFFYSQIEKIKPIEKFRTNVEEPSDISVAPWDANVFYMVSDNGYLHQTDSKGQIVKTAKYRGLDTEAVYAYGENIYAVEEYSRKINVFDKDLNLIKSKTIPYGGGRNKGYEAFTYNEAKKCFVMLTEKDPLLLFELNQNFEVINELKMGKLARDISSATYYKDFLWLLSDEDRQVIQLNPYNYEVIKRWSIPIINPEGFVFLADGKLMVVSDDRGIIYIFDKLLK